MKDEDRQRAKGILLLIALMLALLSIVGLGITFNHGKASETITTKSTNINPWQCTLAEAQNYGGSGNCFQK